MKHLATLFALLAAALLARGEPPTPPAATARSVTVDTNGLVRVPTNLWEATLGLVSVKEARFGAKGDGTTDDTAAIQAAFNALPTVGSYTPGTVHFPPGNYKITAAISVPPVCRITGDGPFASQVIQYTSGANGFQLAAAADTEEHLTIQDLWIMYAGTSNDGGTAIDLSADDGHWDVRNVYITSSGTYDWLLAIKLQNTKFANFDHVWINNVDQGIQSIGTMNNATFSNVRVSNANGTGWLFAGANYSSFIGCQTEDIALERDGFGFSMTNLSTCTFISCASEDNGVTGTSAGTAMQLDNPISVTINGYYITNCRTNAALTTAGYTTQYVNGNGISITDGNNLSLSGIRGSTVEGYGYCVDSGDVLLGWSSFGNIMVGTWGEYNSGAIGIKPDLALQYNDHTIRMGNPDEYYGIYFDAASSRVGIGTINTTSGRELEIRSSPPDIYMTYATSGSSRYSAASDSGNIVPKVFDEYGLGVTLAPFARFEALPAASLPSLTATNAAVYAANNGTKTILITKDSDGTTNTLTAFSGDSGAGGTRGLVPAPAAGDTAAGKFLDASGGWSVPPGSGSSTNVDSLTATNLYVVGITNGFLIANGTNPVTQLQGTAGDIYYWHADGHPTNLAKSSTVGHVLKQGASYPEWGAASGSSPTTTQGDLIVRGASVDERLAKGSVIGSALITGPTGPMWLTGSGGWRIQTHFLAGATPYGELATTTTGTGASAAVITGEADHPGILHMASGTDAAGIALVRSSVTGMSLTDHTWLIFEARVRVNDSYDAGAPNRTFRASFGFGDTGSGTHTDGIYFSYDGSVSTNWLFIVADGGSRTTVTTAVPYVEDAWFTIKCIYDEASANVTAFINGSEISGTDYPVTTNLPDNGDQFGVHCTISNTGTTSTSVSTDLDYVDACGLF